MHLNDQEFNKLVFAYLLCLMSLSKMKY